MLPDLLEIRLLVRDEAGQVHIVDALARVRRNRWEFPRATNLCARDLAELPNEGLVFLRDFGASTWMSASEVLNWRCTAVSSAVMRARSPGAPSFRRRTMNGNSLWEAHASNAVANT